MLAYDEGKVVDHAVMMAITNIRAITIILLIAKHVVAAPPRGLQGLRALVRGTTILSNTERNYPNCWRKLRRNQCVPRHPCSGV